MVGFQMVPMGELYSFGKSLRLYRRILAAIVAANIRRKSCIPLSLIEICARNSNPCLVVMVQTADPLEVARMPNCTGSESVHASMRAWQRKKKISLLEACSVDSNWAAFQVAAYISFESGVHRGSGPTIFELAFRHADMAGSASTLRKQPIS